MGSAFGRRRPVVGSATALTRQGVVATAQLDQSIVDLDTLAFEMSDLLLDGFRTHGEAGTLLVAMSDDGQWWWTNTWGASWNFANFVNYASGFSVLSVYDLEYANDRAH